MNSFAVAFLLIYLILVLLVPRRWAPLPLLGGVCFMTMGQGTEMGPFCSHLFRLVIASN